jgi:hypothetical protein
VSQVYQRRIFSITEIKDEREFIYNESQNRAVSVDVRAMTEALRKIYGTSEVLDELTK